MPTLDSNIVGKTLESVTFKVDAERTKAYAAATNDERPEYMDENRPGGIIAPPLFAVVPASSVASSIIFELGLPLDRMLHGEQDMVFAAAIRPGDVLVTQAQVVDIAAASTGETLSIELTTRTQDGQERVRSLMTAYIRDPSKKRGRRAHERHVRGQPQARSTMTVRPDQPRVYAEASGDHTAPHTDEEFAKAIGFRTVILQGLCTMAFTSKGIVDEVCGGDPTRLKRLKVRFSNVVYPGDGLTTSIWPQDGHYAYETTNQSSAVVIKNGLAEIAQ